MARFRLASVTPTTEALIAAWAPTQPWGPPADVEFDGLGDPRFVVVLVGVAMTRSCCGTTGSH
jgi:hypothetical protein